MMNEQFAPEVAQVRAQLTQARDALRQQAYAFDIEIVIAEAAQPDAQQRIRVPTADGRIDLQSRVERVRELSVLRDDKYAAARRLQERLDALPKEEGDA